MHLNMNLGKYAFRVAEPSKGTFVPFLNCKLQCAYYTLRSTCTAFRSI